MKPAILGPLVAVTALAVFLGTFGLVWSWLPGHVMALQRWIESARHSPEGDATAALFDQSVSAGAIVWNPTTGLIEQRTVPDAGAGLEMRLFDIGEAGMTIASEIRAANAAARYIAIRAVSASGETQCPDAPAWTLSAGAPGLNPAQRLALAAALVEPASALPDPELHAELTRESGAGFGAWRAWEAVGEVEFTVEDPQVERIDVVGALVTAAHGWAIEGQWCRDTARRLRACSGTQAEVVATRIRRTDPAARVRLNVTPLPVLGGSLPAGVYSLSDWISLRCDDAGACRPFWRPGAVARRFARGITPTRADATGAAEPSVPALLGAWGEIRPSTDGRLPATVASPLARDIGAWTVVEQILPAATSLPVDTPYRLTLDTGVQQIAHQVLQELLGPGAGTFASLRAQFPAEGPQVSLVVIDLRDSRSPGAVLAAVGRPEMDPALCPWDRAALSYLSASGPSPGPAAWTGRARHHIPGSVWKLVTALALIDAAVDPVMTSRRADIQAMLTGLTGAEADRLIGPGTLTAAGGLCAPDSLISLPRGAVRNACASLGSSPIRDVGAGGPLASAGPTIRYGLSSAVARSSNIWFAGALLATEHWRRTILASTPVDPAARMAQLGLANTLERLGLTRRAALDGDLGLGVAVRDAALVEALDPAASPRTLAAAAIGQQVQAGPLLLAQVVGSIRRGERLQPALVAPVPLSPPLFPAGVGAEPLLELLRDGMRATVSGRPVGQTGGVGTGANAFRIRAPALRARVGGKTGTAEVSDGERLRVSSFGGWLDTPDNRPGVAIACATTVVGAGNQPEQAAAGLRVPQVCAHVVAELMRRIDAAGLVNP